MRWCASLGAFVVLVLLAGCGSDDDSGAGAGGGSSGASGKAGSGGGKSASGGGGGSSGTAGSGNTPGSGGGSSGSSGSPATFGEVHEGEYHLGPVDFAETEWHNACAPAGGYRAELQGPTGLDGELLAGVSGALAAGGAACDACIQVTTGTGREIVLRVVTYGVTNDPGDIDVSPAAYAALNADEFPRSMSWRFATCPDTGPLRYEFQTEANIYWTSLWVRNPRVPISSVEVQSANHAEFMELRRELDGTVNDDGGFGDGEFTLRITGMNGAVVTETFSGFEPGELVVGSAQF